MAALAASHKCTCGHVRQSEKLICLCTPDVNSELFTQAAVDKSMLEFDRVLRKSHGDRYKIYSLLRLPSSIQDKLGPRLKCFPVPEAFQSPSLHPPWELIEALCDDAYDFFFADPDSRYVAVFVPRQLAPLMVTVLQRKLTLLPEQWIANLGRLYIDNCTVMGQQYGRDHREFAPLRPHHCFLRHWGSRVLQDQQTQPFFLLYIRLIRTPNILESSGHPFLSFLLQNEDSILFSSSVKHCDPRMAEHRFVFNLPLRTESSLIFKLYHRPVNGSENSLILTCVASPALRKENILRLVPGDLDRDVGRALPPPFSLEFVFGDAPLPSSGDVHIPEPLPQLQPTPDEARPEVAAAAPTGLPGGSRAPTFQQRGPVHRGDATAVPTFNEFGVPIRESAPAQPAAATPLLNAVGLSSARGPLNAVGFPPTLNAVGLRPSVPLNAVGLPGAPLNGVGVASGPASAAPGAAQPSTSDQDFFRLIHALMVNMDQMAVQSRRTDPLFQSLVLALPTGKITASMVQGEHSSCNICFEDFVVGEEFRTLPCMHFYHVTCVDEWLPHKAECPVCKLPVTEATVLGEIDVRS